MTYARSEVVEQDEVSIYHCITRCVRRAFLCGNDSVSGKSYEHRREWIRARLSILVEIFSIEVCSYAVMSNHLHSLVRIRPDIANKWSDREVAKRWRMLFPLRYNLEGSPEAPSKQEIDSICQDKKLVGTYRERLSSISWFNRCLNENIARRANREDKCKGRFWEGRFKCQRVLDLAGTIACAAYIDLNPIRAGVSKTIEGSDHTSIQDRIHEKQGRTPSRSKRWAKIKLVSIKELFEGELTFDEYLEIVDETGRAIVSGKASISSDIAPILERLKIKPDEWIKTTTGFKGKFKRVVGVVSQIKEVARKAKKSCFHGIASAKLAFEEN